MLSQDELNKIRERAEKATKKYPAPWQWYQDNDGFWLMSGEPGNESSVIPPIEAHEDFPDRPQAELLAHCATDIPALLEHVAEVEARLKAFAQLVWESRWVSDEPDYQQAVGIAAEIRSGNYEGIDSARQALARKEGV